MVTQAQRQAIQTGSGCLIDVIPYVMCLWQMVLDMRSIRGGPYQPYIVWRVGLQVGYKEGSIWVYGKYLQGIRYLSYLKRYFFIVKMSSDCLTVHANKNWAPQALILWAGPPLVVWPMSIVVGTWGYTPHSQSSSALYLLSNAVLNKSEQFNLESASKSSNLTSLTGNRINRTKCRPV